ncbi:MAG TPA: cytochrome P460 family protein, partial [Chitinophagaceae bacterium]|nr:cytochrome P460 family protein [Chitinophagaceae bacterium]
SISNPAISKDVVASDSFKMVLRTACYNCHSNEVKLAWFDKISPASWLVARDIREGRKVLNFSEWDKLSHDRQKGLLFEILNQAQFGSMPLKDYTFMHPQAKISPWHTGILERYLRTLMVKPGTDSSKIAAWYKQYQYWTTQEASKTTVNPSLNGFLFDASYKNWVVINSTVRTDNGTLKMIMGNDIAVKAVIDHQTNPWPDGTAFAKLTWTAILDTAGNLVPGEYKQIAFMRKDALKYKTTDGWGFSQWDKGLEMATHGKTALFTTECVNCHKPMKAYDYVFTIPLPLREMPALQDRLITSMADSQGHSMSTLYGNDIATAFARSPKGNVYPAGAILTLVTWKQQDHEHWFGGKMPATMQGVEKVVFVKGNSEQVDALYEGYKGNARIKLPAQDTAFVQSRIDFITSQRASIMP